MGAPIDFHPTLLKIEHLMVGQIALEMLPSSTLTEKNTFFQLVVMGQEPCGCNTLEHGNKIN